MCMCVYCWTYKRQMWSHVTYLSAELAGDLKQASKASFPADTEKLTPWWKCCVSVWGCECECVRMWAWVGEDVSECVRMWVWVWGYEWSVWGCVWVCEDVSMSVWGCEHEWVRMWRWGGKLIRGKPTCHSNYRFHGSINSVVHGSWGATSKRHAEGREDEQSQHVDKVLHLTSVSEQGALLLSCCFESITGF